LVLMKGRGLGKGGGEAPLDTLIDWR